MQITHTRIAVPDAYATATFLHQLLELPTSFDSAQASAEVEVGSSRLELETDSGMIGYHHLAFLIPDASFRTAKRLLIDRAHLLQADGHDEIETSPEWNARSLYFEAPDGTVLELIARRDLETPARGMGPADVLSISEVGVAIRDVPATARALGAEASIGLYQETTPGEEFCAVGDINGLLILVAVDRPWFPTSRRVAREQRMSIRAVGNEVGEYRLGGRTTLSITRSS